MEEPDHIENLSIIEEQLTPFFQERLRFIKENKYPTTLIQDPPAKFMFHFIPDNFQNNYLDIRKLNPDVNHLLPIGEAPETILYEYNFDGILFFSSVHEKHAYIQLFRDGRTETVVAVAQTNPDSRENLLPILNMHKNLISCLSNHLLIMQKFGISGPFYLFIRFLDIENLKINPIDIEASGIDAKGLNKALTRNELIFPVYKLEHIDINLKAVLSNFFNILWNTFGFKEAPSI